VSHDDDRTPPRRVRITGLQEAQLRDLVQVDAACSQMFYAMGFDAAEVPARSSAELVALTRDHDIHVAEADHTPAGFLVWRDEAPGVAYIADLAVAPDYQRFGIGTRLLQALGDDAREKKLELAVVRCWQKAGWAMAFYAANGFVAIDGHTPEKVRSWRAQQESTGKPVTRPGEIVMWAALKTPVADDAPTTEGGLDEEDF
jgi:amino-acid N-acetyltransferase